MKLLGMLLMTVSLTAATLAASLAYHVSIVDSVVTSKPNVALVDLKVADDFPITDDDLSALQKAGVEKPEKKKTVIDAGTKLTKDHLAIIHRISQEEATRREYIRVHEFAFGRWPAGWIFLGALGGMVFASVLMRHSAQRDVAAEQEQAASSPQSLLQAARDTLATLNRELAETPPEEQQARILATCEALQAGPLADFVETREAMINEIGLGRFAALMDDFASADRHVNRAWTTATDGYLEDAVECLKVAEEKLGRTLS